MASAFRSWEHRTCTVGTGNQEYSGPLRCRQHVDSSPTSRSPLRLLFHQLNANRFQHATPEMLQLLSQLRHKVAIGFVGGSDLAKQQEQLGTFLHPRHNPLRLPASLRTGSRPTAWVCLWQATASIKWIGEDNYKKLVRFILHYVRGS